MTHLNGVALLLLLISLTALNTQASENDSPFLKVTPTICIIEGKQKVCEFNITIKLQITPYDRLCLVITKRPELTQCFEEQQVVSQQITLKTAFPIAVKLINPEDNNIVLQQLLSIASYEAKNYRIKRRFGWSL
jgi:hypothetical protein